MDDDDIQCGTRNVIDLKATRSNENAFFINPEQKSVLQNILFIKTANNILRKYLPTICSRTLEISKDKQTKIYEVIQQTNFENLNIISSNVDLSGLEVETAGDNRRAFKLKDELGLILNDSRASYDYILLDCTPSLSLLTIMALVASDALVVPLQTEFFALEGLTQLMKTIERIKTNLNPSLDIRGILLTMYDKRNKLSGEVETEARNYFKDKVYSTAVPRNVRLSEAPSHGVPVLIYDKACPGSKAYFSFTEEFLNQDKPMESSAA